jgi:hypothetical protein
VGAKSPSWPESRGIGKAKASETHANLGGLGMDQCKRFGILVEAWGEGTEIAGIAVIARNPKGKP